MPKSHGEKCARIKIKVKVRSTEIRNKTKLTDILLRVDQLGICFEQTSSNSGIQEMASRSRGRKVQRWENELKVLRYKENKNLFLFSFPKTVAFSVRRRRFLYRRKDAARRPDETSEPGFRLRLRRRTKTSIDHRDDFGIISGVGSMSGVAPRRDVPTDAGRGGALSYEAVTVRAIECSLCLCD
ncbi:hypothetical protein EVAR_38525_1 [Eumeta japonica]|uniref:Uncharacterized protein n=1 Tax=Eumeta variegata TaxID=151549 RepID=A0A4C1WBW0_EUMVA|nr:hypothetical protein EVAR_38525_1 [Eumeta japonica]